MWGCFSGLEAGFHQISPSAISGHTVVGVFSAANLTLRQATSSKIPQNIEDPDTD
jgi:hypothetical protein